MDLLDVISERELRLIESAAIHAERGDEFAAETARGAAGYSMLDIGRHIVRGDN